MRTRISRLRQAAPRSALSETAVHKAYLSIQEKYSQIYCFRNQLAAYTHGKANGFNWPPAVWVAFFGLVMCILSVLALLMCVIFLTDKKAEMSN